MEQQEVNSIMLMVDGVVAMDEDEVDAVLVVAVVFVAMTESKTQSVMKRFQALQVEVKGEVGVWGEVEVFELMDLYQHQPQQDLFEVHSGVVTKWFIDFFTFKQLSDVVKAWHFTKCTYNEYCDLWPIFSIASLSLPVTTFFLNKCTTHLCFTYGGLSYQVSYCYIHSICEPIWHGTF
jgi:hypothetical protein